ncbi:hypothetical protein CFB84_33480 [Burkholderia aenigmatica]|uniref:Uncharacterized protein n=1 Tax=Burkholderia aenigmatica TaxID=2015348 RepID=A0A228I4A2_9BURK|nr:hypothetical protein CFB84_33480 [Burkholderia aenigmatica]
MSTIPALEVEIHASMGRHRAQYQGKPASGTSARPHWFPFRPLTPNPSCHWSPFSICSRVPPIALRETLINGPTSEVAGEMASNFLDDEANRRSIQ